MGAFGRCIGRAEDPARSTTGPTGRESGGAGRVRISAAPGFARKWLLPVLARLLDEHPAITFDVLSSYALADLADDGACDALTGRRPHAFLLPEGARLPFRTAAPRFRFEDA